MEKQKALRVAAVVFGCSAVAVGIANWLGLRKGDTPGYPSSFPTAMPVVPARPDPSDPEEPATHLYQAEKQGEISENDALDWLMSTLESKSKDPEALRQAKDFRTEVMKNPTLKEKLEGLRRAPRRTPAETREALRGLAQMPEFRQIVGKIRGDASSSARLDTAALLTAARAKASVEPRATAPPILLPASLRNKRSGTSLLAAIDTFEQARQRVLAQMKGGSTEGPATRAGSERAADKPTAVAAGGSSDAQAPPKKADSSDAHNVAPKLENISTAGPGDWNPEPTRGHLTEWLILLDPTARRAIEAVITEHGQWGACYVTGYYRQCVDTCNRLTKTSCGSIPSYYQACRSENVRSRATCVRECTDKAADGCQVPIDEQRLACKEGAPGIPACGYCRKDQDYGPVIPGMPPFQPKGCGAGVAAVAAAPVEPQVDIYYRVEALNRLCSAKYQGSRVVSYESGCPPPPSKQGLWRELDGEWVLFFNGKPAPTDMKSYDFFKLLRETYPL